MTEEFNGLRTNLWDRSPHRQPMKFIVATLALLVLVFMSGSIFVVAGAINNKSFLEYWVGYLSRPL